MAISKIISIIGGSSELADAIEGTIEDVTVSYLGEDLGDVPRINMDLLILDGRQGIPTIPVWLGIVPRSLVVLPDAATLAERAKWYQLGVGTILLESSWKIELPAIIAASNSFRASVQVQPPLEGSFQEIPLAICHVDLEGTITRLNDRFADLFEYGPEEMVGVNVSTITHPSDIAQSHQVIESLCSGKSEVVSVEKRYVKKNGQNFWGNSTISLEHQEDGVLRIVAAIQDISERKRYEEQAVYTRNMLERTESLAHVGSWTWDVEKDVTTWSHELYNIFQKDSTELPPSLNEHQSLYTKDSYQLLMDSVEEALRSGRNYSLNLDVLRPDGTIRHAQCLGFAEKDQDGKVIRLYGSFQDITEFFEAKKELLEKQRELEISESRFRSFMDNCPVSVYLKDSDSTYVYLNKAVENIAGKPKESIIGCRTSEIFEGELGEKLTRIDSEVISSGSLRIDEAKFITPKGKSLWMRHYKFRIPGDPPMLGGFGIDVTERKLARELIEASETRFRNFFEQGLAGFFIHDMKGNILDVNNKLSELSGAPRKEMIGFNVLNAHADGVSRVIGEKALAQLQEFGEARFEATYQRRDGTQFIAEVHTKVIDLAGHRVAQGIMTDLTERRFVEKERDALQAQLQHSQRMDAIGRLAGGVAHDFNNILQGIQGFSDLLLDISEEGSMEKEFAQEIFNSAERAGELTRQLLSISRRDLINKRRIELSPVLNSILKMLGRVLGSHISLRYNPSGDPLWTNSDPSQIEQIVLNLAINARDAMPDGGELSITAKKSLVENDPFLQEQHSKFPSYCHLRISDSGTGIDPMVLPNIFDPFFTTKEIGSGTGLGLSTVYGIVQQHSGHISVSSSIGKGTTFDVYFPFDEVESLESNQKDLFDNARATGTECIMIVEDNDAVRRMVGRVLGKQGYAVEMFPAGEPAIEYMQKSTKNIDMLITDIMMPGVNGIVVAESFSTKFPSKPIILMSGFTSGIVDSNFLQRSEVTFLEKPFSPVDLLRIIRTVSGQK